MTYARRVDDNHAEIVAALRKIGCSIIDISELGGGAPDLIVGYRGVWYVLEIKNPQTQYGRKGFNKNQKAWIAEVAGRAPVYIITSALEAISFMQEAGE